MLDTLLLCFLTACCHTYGVEPEFALAVARVESGTKTQDYRIGRLGKSDFWGPMGVKGCFLKTGSPFEVIEKGVKALRETAGNEAKMIDRAKTYNPNWRKNRYLVDLMACYRQNRRQR